MTGRRDSAGDSISGGAPPLESSTGPGAADQSTRPIDAWMYELMARLAHDMRTPLGAIRMWSHVLRAGKDSDRPAALEAIDASTRAQSEMIAFLADLSSAVVGRLPIEKQTCDLRSLVRGSVEIAAREAALRGVTVDLQITVADDEALLLDGDPGRLRQALTCLVAAASAHAPADGTVIARLTAAGPGRAAVVVVRTPRAGVGDDETGTLFTPYLAGRSELGYPRPHFGLGPVFARCVARVHGGDVYAAHEGDEGALVFTIRLPLRPALAPAQP